MSELQDINLFFTILAPPEEHGHHTEAFVPGLLDIEIEVVPCPILVLPTALGGAADDAFKQVIAHEVFHCVQYWRQGRPADEVADWYIEGMAEYFSGVVYPDANIEHQFLAGFNYYTAVESILDLQYSSWVFFQYLGNRFGKEFVIQMLDVLPTTGTKTEQAIALSGMGDMSHVFHEFGQSFLDGQLSDENGGILPLTPYYPPRNRFLLAPAPDRHLEAAPFQLARYQLVYEEAKEYLIELETVGGTGVFSARQGEPGAWGNLPLEVSTGCDDVVYIGLVTNTDAASDYQMTTHTQWLEEYRCDRCLIGTWMQDTPEIESHIRALATDANIASVRGQFFLEIDESTMKFTPMDYGIKMENDGELVDFSIVGTSTSTYIVSADNLILAFQETFDFTGTFTGPWGSYSAALGPEAAGMIPSLSHFGPHDYLDPSVAEGVDLGGGAGDSEGEPLFGYECTNNTLTVFPPTGVTPITSSTYVRVSDSAP